MAGEKEVDNGADSGRTSSRKRSFSPARIFGGILSWGFRLFLILIVLALLFVFGYAISSIWTEGGISAYTKDVSVALDNSGAGNIFDKIKSSFDDLIHPGRATTYTSIVEQNEDNQQLGVKIVSFSGTPSEYLVNPGDTPPIRATAVIEASSLGTSSFDVAFDCSMNDLSGDMVVQPENITFPPGKTVYRRTIFCSIPDDGYVSLNAGKLNTKRIDFDVLFDALAYATYDAYLMRSSIYMAFESEEIDPWIYYLGQRPDNLRLGNVVVSRTTAGPINLGIGTPNNQPFLDDNSLIPLQVSLTPSWRGNIKYVKSITLRIPPEIELEENPLFCDFQFTGDYDGEYKLYELTPYALNEKLNKDCSPEAIAGTGLSEASCMEHFKSDLQLQCNMYVPPFDLDMSNFYLAPIVAEADYVFSLERSTNVNIRTYATDTDTNVCKYYDETACKNTEGCKPEYSNDEFDACIMCSEKNCQDYDSQEDCDNDYCQVANAECKFENGFCDEQLPA